MSNAHVLRGVTTISFYADNIREAKQWYTEFLGVNPYFERPDTENPIYVEFRLGDYQQELGIIDREFAPQNTVDNPGGVIVYWHVDDIADTLERLIMLGAEPYEALTKRGEGFITASVLDPFGNVLGIMYNAHYVEVLSLTKG